MIEIRKRTAVLTSPAQSEWATRVYSHWPKWKNRRSSRHATISSRTASLVGATSISPANSKRHWIPRQAKTCTAQSHDTRQQHGLISTCWESTISPTKNSAAHLDFSTLNQVPETHSIIEGTHSIMIYSIMYYDNTNGVFDPFIPTYPKSYDLKKGDTMARSSVQITTVCEWTVPFMRRHFSGPFRQKFFRSSDISVTPLNVLHSSYMHPISCAQDTRCPILLSKMVREPIYG